MRFGMFLLLILVPAVSWGASILGPADFEQLWLLNNQRNLIKRYQQRTQRVLQDQQALYSLDLDATANQTIKTSAGDKEAILDRMGIHYQSAHTLFLVDWLSLIPQPQTTEGFTYGDTVLGYSWQQNDELRFTLGGRLLSTPKSTQLAGDTVFDLSSNATRDQLGGFVHVNYLGWDFGTYYSSQDGNQATSLHLPLLDTSVQQLTGALTYLAGAADLGIAPRYEFSLDDRYRFSHGRLQSGMTIAALTSTSLSNAYLVFDTTIANGLEASAGLFHSYLPDSQESLPGAKLGVKYTMDLDGEFSMAFYVRQNSFGDIDAMVIKNEPVFSFNLSARPQF